jgi:hypothetical protein
VVVVKTKLVSDKRFPFSSPAKRLKKCAVEVLLSDAVLPQRLEHVKMENLVKSNTGERDFTIHIEPDWNNDLQTCLVVYRHKGRVIARVNPRQIDLALARYISNKAVDDEASDDESDSSLPYRTLTECEIVQLSVFQGGKSVEPDEQLIEIAEQVPGYRW